LSVQAAAPEENVPAQGRDGQYWLVSGTSPACALTFGVAALIRARYPHLAPALVVRAITSSTQRRPRGGYDDRVGFGTVDAVAALTAAGQLAGHQRAGPGTATTVHFGGGAAAVPPDPVQPRGVGGLITAILAGLGCLVLAWLTASRLRALRRAGRSRGQHAADPRQPQPAWPGPRGGHPAGGPAGSPAAGGPAAVARAAAMTSPADRGVLPEFASQVLDVAD